jgi:hypothetical protein
MNRKERRRLHMIGIAVSEVSAIAEKEALKIAMEETRIRFNIAFDIMINTFYEAMRESRISQERADKIVHLIAEKVATRGNEIAKASIEKMEGKHE